MVRIHAVDVDRHVRPAAPRQRARGRLSLDVEQLAQPVPAEVGQLGHVGVQPRDLHVGAELTHRLAHELLDEAGLLQRKMGRIVKFDFDNRRNTPYGDIADHIIY